MYNHANLGISYLLKLGYKNDNIIINVWPGSGKSGMPDLTTKNDNINWEIKLAVGQTITFTFQQFANMKEGDIVLIFSSYHKSDPVDVIKFGDILDGKYDHKYKFVVNLVLDISSATIVIEYLTNIGYYTNTEKIGRRMMALKRQYTMLTKPKLTTICGEVVKKAKDGIVIPSNYDGYVIAFLTSYKDLLEEVTSTKDNSVLMKEIRDDILKYLYFQLRESRDLKDVLLNVNNKWIRTTLRNILENFVCINILTEDDIHKIMNEGNVPEKYIKDDDQKYMKNNLDSREV